MKRIFLIIIFFSLSLSAVQNKKVVLQLAWLHQFQFAGYYMAKELGYYRDAGIDLQIKEYSYNMNVVDTVESHHADFAISHSELIIDKINGKDVVALGSIYQIHPLMLLTRNDTGIKTLKDLKNKKIMITSNADNTVSLLAMLNANGLTEKDIKIIPHSFNLQDLINKKTDAMASYLSNEPIRLEELGIEYKVFHPKEFGFNFYGDILFSSSSFIKKNPDLTKAFYEATLKGWQYAFTNIAKTSELIFKKYNTQNKTLITYVKEGEVLKSMAYYENGKYVKDTLGHIHKEKLEKIVDVYKVLGLVNKNLNTDEFIYEYNHPKAIDMHFTIKEMYLSAVSFISILSLIIYSVKRKKWLLTQNELKDEVKRQQVEIDKKNKLIMVQSKIAAVGEMLGNIGHQWRQPLASITASISNMQIVMDLEEEFTKEQSLHIIENVNRQCQYLSRTIDDFSSFFHTDSTNVETFNLKNAILEAEILSKDSFRNNFIKTVIQLDDFNITDNQNTSVQSILNLFNNAKDAIVFNDIPTDNRYYFIKSEKIDNIINIRFTDSGGGVDEKNIDKVFEPYFTTKDKSRGTGLGMYMTHQIITKHLNGTISVSNKEYEYEGKKLKGAEFLITLAV